jgi:hypothetical protein
MIGDRTGNGSTEAGGSAERQYLALFWYTRKKKMKRRTAKHSKKLCEDNLAHTQWFKLFSLKK